MGIYGDAFQKLVSLSNSPEKELRENLNALLEELRAIAASGGTLTQFLDDGEREYLDLLSSRGKHHLAQAKAYCERVRTLLVAPVDGDNAQQLRDFHHHIYYAAFYCGRYALLANSQCDCTNHGKLPEVLKLLEKKLTPPVQDILVRIWEKVTKLKENRNDADYIMSMKRLSELASTQIIVTTTDSLYAIYQDWGLL